MNYRISNESQKPIYFIDKLKIIELVKTKNSQAIFGLPLKINSVYINDILDALEMDFKLLYQIYDQIKIIPDILAYNEKTFYLSCHPKNKLYTDHIKKFFHKNTKKYYISFDYRDIINHKAISINISEVDILNNKGHSYNRIIYF
jgi:hypothetical protein